MHQLNLQLYGRTTKKTFSEQLSVRKSVTLTPQPSKIELPLRVPGREKFVELRLDPDDKPSTFVLHELRIRAQDGSEIYSWDGSPESLKEPIDLRAWRSNEDVLVETKSNDPFLLIPFAEPHGGTVVLELSVSQNLAAPHLADAGSAVTALSAHQQELAEAVLSLQGNLRQALDDLASEQEGLQDALAVHHAHARGENDAVRLQLSEVLGRTEVLEAALQKTTTDVSALESTFAVALSEVARETKDSILAEVRSENDAVRQKLSDVLGYTETLEGSLETTMTDLRNSVLAEIRDDWRSVIRQIKDRAEAASKDASDREAELSATREAEFAKVLATLERLAVSQSVMEKVRTELGIFRDEDAPIKLQQLKAEAQIARAQIEEFESSIFGRLMRPFSSRKTSQMRFTLPGDSRRLGPTSE